MSDLSPAQREAALWGMALGEALGERVAGMTPAQAREMSAQPASDEVLQIGSVSTQGLIVSDVLLVYRTADLDQIALAYSAWADADPPSADGALVSFFAGAPTAADLRARSHAWHARTGISNDPEGVGRAIAMAVILESAMEAITSARLEAELTHYDPLAGAFAAGVAQAVDAFGRGVDDPLALVRDEVGGYAPLEEAVALASARDFAAIAALCDGPRADSCEAVLAVGLAVARWSPGWDQGMGWALSLGRNAPARGALVGALMGVRDPVSVPIALARNLHGASWVRHAANIVGYVPPLPGAQPDDPF